MEHPDDLAALVVDDRVRLLVKQDWDGHTALVSGMRLLVDVIHRFAVVDWIEEI